MDSARHTIFNHEYLYVLCINIHNRLFEYFSPVVRLVSSCTIFVISLVRLILSYTLNSFQTNQTIGKKRRHLERKVERKSTFGKKTERKMERKYSLILHILYIQKIEKQIGKKLKK